MTRRVSAVVISMLVLILLGASPAAAQNQLRITGLEEDQGTLQIGLASAGGSIDEDSVSVTLNGLEVPVTTQPLSETAIRRVAVMSIDTSGSMAGEPIENAKAAAQAFLSSVPADVLVGLVSFDDTAQVVLEPTTDRAVVSQAVDALELGGDTALYDAVVTSVEAAGEEGSRRVLLLTDGQNTIGDATEEEAVAAASDNDTIVDAVALGDADVDALQAIAEASGGSVIETQDPAALVGLFGQAAEAVASEVLVTAETPPAFAGSVVAVALTATVDGQPATATATTTLTGTPPVPSPTVTPTPTPTGEALPQPAPPPAFVASTWFVPTAIAVVFLGLLLLLGLAFLPLARRREDDVTKRMSVYTLTGGRPKEVERKQASTSSAVATQALGAADVFVKSRGLEPRLETRLTAASLPLRPAEWVLIQAAAAIGGGLLLLLVSGFSPLWMIAGIALGILIPQLVLRIRTSQRQTSFEQLLPDTLTLMAGSLSAGYSLPQAVDTVVKEGQEPVSEEFSKALVEARLGVPIEETLENIAVRTQSKDFAWVVMAISIQRQVGGNLSEILRIVAETLRERAYVKRQIRTLSAEGRLSAVVIAALPPLFMLYLLLVRPDYVTLLFTETLGIIMLVVAVVLQIAGVLVMRRIVNFEV